MMKDKIRKKKLKKKHETQIMKQKKIKIMDPIIKLKRN